VGHSLGGLYVQYFARNYPQEVSGVLLVDPTHPRQLERLKTEAPGAYRTLKTASLLMSPIMKRELADSEVAGEQVLASPAWADMPVVVLSSTRASLGELPSFRTLETRLQDEIAASIPSARHERVQGSGHYIQRDRPEVVIRVARQLAGCAG
jgi:pimeloyl-ACP methyl ester carboxylesterase